MSSKRDGRGFSLLELLIVVAVILIIATIAVPSLLRSRQAANESAAVANLKTINAALVAYASSHSSTYGAVADLVTKGLVDTRFLAGVSGYDYVITLSGDAFDFTAAATATSPNTGRYDFYSTPDFVIRYSTVTSRAPAGFNGQPVQN